MAQVAIVTGASRGIGAAIALRLAAHGMHVALTARTLEPGAGRDGSLSDVVGEIRAAGGTAVAVGADLSVPDDRRRIVDEATRQLGPVDVLVNNAAVTFMYPFTDFPEKRWRLMFEVQVRAPYELAQLVVPGMVERGEGWILNISSRAGLHPEGPPFPAVHVAPWTAYGMVKAALDRFSTALAAELSPHGVAVNALAPWDNVATPGAMAHDLVEGFALESPDLMAEAALLLCTGDPAALTGRVATSQQLLAELRPETTR
jgi:NAD(P)-dependent dehydrogenase (short-subunit alcohol dehydrogenase family)